MASSGTRTRTRTQRSGATRTNYLQSCKLCIAVAGAAGSSSRSSSSIRSKILRIQRRLLLLYLPRGRAWMVGIAIRHENAQQAGRQHLRMAATAPPRRCLVWLSAAGGRHRLPLATLRSGGVNAAAHAAHRLRSGLRSRQERQTKDNCRHSNPQRHSDTATHSDTA